MQQPCRIKASHACSKQRLYCKARFFNVLCQSHFTWAESSCFSGSWCPTCHHLNFFKSQLLRGGACKWTLSPRTSLCRIDKCHCHWETEVWALLSQSSLVAPDLVRDPVSYDKALVHVKALSPLCSPLSRLEYVSCRHSCLVCFESPMKQNSELDRNHHSFVVRSSMPQKLFQHHCSCHTQKLQQVLQFSSSWL